MDQYDFIKAATMQGMPEAQALSIASYVQESQGEMVTKSYLDKKLADLRLDARFAEVDARMMELKNDMLKWYVGIAVVQSSAMLGGIVALARSLAH